MKRYFNRLHYSKQLNFADSVVLSLLSAITPFYEAGIKVRNWIYKNKIYKTSKLPAYVISVGNLTTGGTGKTPITVEIANYIREKHNRKVAVLSHGYGGKLSTNQVNIISNGKQLLTTPHMAGDEPYLIAENLKDVPVITGRNRFNSGIAAIEQFNSEVLILDDGFQHIKLERDLNILVIDSQKQFGNQKVLPAGPLREPMSEIKRAHKIIIVNKKPFDMAAVKSCEKLALEIRTGHDKPVYICNFNNGGIFNIQTCEQLTDGKTIYAFAAIAQPELFFNYLKDLDIKATREFTDHHLYTEADIQDIIKEAQSSGAEAVVTTEKDAVKLSALFGNIQPQIPFYALKLKPELNLDEIIEL